MKCQGLKTKEAEQMRGEMFQLQIDSEVVQKKRIQLRRNCAMMKAGEMPDICAGKSLSLLGFRSGTRTT